jgi:hydrogenase-4 transcriptional activator
MELFRDLLLDAWREVCRHIEIQEATHNLARRLARQLPISAVIVRQFTTDPVTITTAAQAAVGSYRLPPLQTVPLSPTVWKRVQSWGREWRVTLRAQGESPREIKPLLPDGLTEDLLLGPLTFAETLTGMLLLVAAPGKHFEKSHRDVAESLLEPFSVALQNDHRLRELAALREAAEADRRSLLTRLGRNDLSDTIVGADSGLKPIMERVALVARSDVPVLILGETGTGKEVFSRAIHNRSLNPSGPFIRVNCGAIPPELIDSQLFGHEKGSFTGASEMRKGWFERADGGTLFLDEVGELPLSAQVRLLRVLQDHELERVGGQQSIRVDVRIVAATHRDLPALVQAKEFREDLWYRLAVFPIVLPPLRERQSDIPALARHFAGRAATRFGLQAVPPTELDIELLTSYPWPGNIRELGTVIDRAAILGDGKTLEIATALGVAPQLSRRVPIRSTDESRLKVPSNSISICSLDDAVRLHIEHALQMTRGRIEGPKGTATLLKVNPHTLRARMRKLGIEWSHHRE